MAALRNLPKPDSKAVRRAAKLCVVASLFEKVDGKEAFLTLQQEGIPELIGRYDQLENGSRELDVLDLLRVLRVFAIYRTREGTERILRAVKRPLGAESYYWELIFSEFGKDHPDQSVLIARLRPDLPAGFAGVAFLDLCNDLLRAKSLESHPFDSEVGRKRLESYLRDSDESHYSYARSAVMALPFLAASGDRNNLLKIADVHPSPGVTVDAAWARAKAGDEQGIRTLVKFCLDLRLSESATTHLENLGRKDAIPKEALEPSFAAKGEFAEWLSHPSELGKYPDDLEIVASRVLHWPTQAPEKTTTCWLIRYTLARSDGLIDRGVGIVGPTTWCSPWDEYLVMAPDDVFGCYAAWHMVQKKMLESVHEPTESDLSDVLSRWKGAELREVRLRSVERVQGPKDGRSQLVGIADAVQSGKAGWAVFDGASSAFYPKDGATEGFYYGHVLAAHVGRRALGLDAPPRSDRWKKPVERPRDYAKTISHFEEILARINAGTNVLDDERPGDMVFDQRFSRYAEALGKLNRGQELRPVLELLQKHWRKDREPNYVFGMAAWEAGLKDVALRYLDAATDRNRISGRGNEASILATLLWDAGRRDEARTILVGALRAAAAEAKAAGFLSDRFLHEEWFQGFRRTALQLFRDEGPPWLESEKIPASTLSPPLTIPAKQ
ncbi:MAG TPA: hypothetical protein VNM14_25460 [Planctomycetota bacterium]|nr:hypothetical protein [Planctomycetota bacterium]